MTGFPASALPGGYGLVAPIEVEFLNSAGLVWRGLVSLWQANPDDYHPSLSQIRDQCARLGRNLCERTISRSLAHLERLNKLLVEPDPDHPVGRKIVPLTPLTVLSPPDKNVHDKNVPSYVERESASALHVIRGDDRNVIPPGSPSESLTHLLGRLEQDDLAVEPAVRRLCREYGESFEPFYRKTCLQVRSGELAIGDLILAVEYAEGPKIIHAGKAFVARIKRVLGGLMKPRPLATPPPKKTPPPVEPVREPEVKAEVKASPEPIPVPEPITTLKPEESLPVLAAPLREVEVIPAEQAPASDAQMAFAIDMLGSHDGVMFLTAIKIVRACGRGDLITPEMIERAGRIVLGRERAAAARKQPAGRPLPGPPAGS